MSLLLSLGVKLWVQCTGALDPSCILSSGLLVESPTSDKLLAIGPLVTKCLNN